MEILEIYKDFFNSMSQLSFRELKTQLSIYKTDKIRNFILRRLMLDRYNKYKQTLSEIQNLTKDYEFDTFLEDYQKDSSNEPKKKIIPKDSLNNQLMKRMSNEIDIIQWRKHNFQKND